MRRILIPLTLLLVFFVIPLHIFIIGDFTGIGIQGAVYKIVISGYGTFFFPITREFQFVLNGTYWGRTALSVVLWGAGAVVLAATTAVSLIRSDAVPETHHKTLIYGIVISCLLFLGSCIAQYGFLFSSPSGISIPVGIVFILVWIAILHWFWNAKNP